MINVKLKQNEPPVLYYYRKSNGMLCVYGVREGVREREGGGEGRKERSV
jgi:hypothetical protein